MSRSRDVRLWQPLGRGNQPNGVRSDRRIHSSVSRKGPSLKVAEIVIRIHFLSMTMNVLLRHSPEKACSSERSSPHESPFPNTWAAILSIWGWNERISEITVALKMSSHAYTGEGTQIGKSRVPSNEEKFDSVIINTCFD